MEKYGMEKRSEERLAYSLRAAVLDPMTKHVLSDAVRVLNISRKGLSLLADKQVMIHTPYLFKVSLNYVDFIYLKGRVVRSKADELFQNSGVSCEPAEMDDRISLNRFLADRIPTYKRRMRLYALGVAEVVFLLGHFLGHSPLSAAVVALFVFLVLLIWSPF